MVVFIDGLWHVFDEQRKIKVKLGMFWASTMTKISTLINLFSFLICIVVSNVLINLY